MALTYAEKIAAENARRLAEKLRADGGHTATGADEAWIQRMRGQGYDERAIQRVIDQAKATDRNYQGDYRGDLLGGDNNMAPLRPAAGAPPSPPPAYQSPTGAPQGMDGYLGHTQQQWDNLWLQGHGYKPRANTSWDWTKVGGGTGTQTVDSGGLPSAGSGLSGKAPPSSGPKGPWLPGATNDEYYSRQFRAITEQRNAHQEAQKAAALRAQAAAANPAPVQPTDWSWARNGKGLPAVDVAPTGQQWNRASWVKPGETTIADIFRQYMGSGGSADNLTGFDINAPHLQDTGWSTVNNPTDLTRLAIGTGGSGNYWDFQNKAIQNMFTQTGVETPEGGGPTAAPGYALPISLAKS